METMELKEKGQDYGASMPELLGTLDLNTSSLRTPQCCLFEDWKLSYATLPPQGMMRNGKLYRQKPLAFLTSERDVSLLPTPCKADAIGVIDTFQALKNYINANHQKKLVYLCRLHGISLRETVAIYEKVMGFSENYTDVGLPPVETL